MKTRTKAYIAALCLLPVVLCALPIMMLWEFYLQNVDSAERSFKKKEGE